MHPTALSSPANRLSLQNLGKEIHLSPLPGSDRCCLITMGDETTRLGITQVSNHTHPRGAHAGAQFLRVSFRLVGDESEPASQFHTKSDTLWVLIDPKSGDVVWGPEEGLHVRTRGAGIGSYLLGQILRQISQLDLKSYYRLQDIALPMPSSDDLTKEEAAENSSRVEHMLSRVGFYISGSGGGLVAGVRKLHELKGRWNQDKVRFLNPGQLIEHADKWLTVSAQSTSQCLRLHSVVDKLQSELKSQQEASRRHIQERQAFTDDLRQGLLSDEQSAVAAPNHQLTSDDSPHVELGPLSNHEALNAAPFSAFAAGQIHISVSRSLMIWLWAVFGLGAAHLILALASFG